MTWIELAGPVGAGKSSLLPLVAAAYVRQGRGVMALDEALRRAGLHTRSLPLSRKIRDARLASAFLARRPRLAWHAACAAASLPVPMWHRRAITGRILALAASDHRVRRRSGRDVILVDEGWVHRAVNLFAWGDRPIDERLDAYLSVIPRPDAVVLIDSPEIVIRERLAIRGLPKRLRSSTPDETKRFLERSRIVVDRSGAWLDAHGVPVNRITNDSSLHEASEQLSDGVLLAGAEGAAA